MGLTKLSSLDVPLTGETRKRLESAGIPATTISGLSEMGGQSLLALRNAEEDNDEKPVCYRRKYNPKSALCMGCIVAVSCWRSDRPYLERVKGGHSDPPPGVPSKVVSERVKVVTERPVAPPPPRKKTKGKKRGKKNTRGSNRRSR